MRVLFGGTIMLSWKLNIVIFLVGEKRLKLEEPKHLKLVIRGPIQPNTVLDPIRKFHFLYPHQPRRRRRLYPLLSATTPASEQAEMKVTRGCKFSFHVTVVAAAIAYIYFSTVFVFIDQWLGLWSSPGMLNAVLFSVVALFCIFSYALAIYTDPGRVPSSFVPDVEDPENTVQEIKRKVCSRFFSIYRLLQFMYTIRIFHLHYACRNSSYSVSLVHRAALCCLGCRCQSV